MPFLDEHYKKGRPLWPAFYYFLVPEARIELARTQGPLDFESSASTNFTTPARCGFVYEKTNRLSI